ncbi:hypothetical protein MTR_8g465240 [Medicago truncatula]|uniref:Uncharacterized protein n=1 Tax=Medicago truncatula TaxID=3880 RepID=A0A072U1E5_MEDTR|nr:hypothetical protein MTR_8g465240 [Medicago truncatula]
MIAEIVPAIQQPPSNSLEQLILHSVYPSIHTGMNIGWIESCSKRKGLGADSVRKYKDWKTKYVSPKVRSLARPVLALARPCHPPELLLLLLLRF